MPEEHDEPSALVERASEGDVAAVDELLDRYLPGLRGYVRAQAGDLVRAREESVDLVQSVCREVLERLADERFEYRGEAEFKQWLYRAAQLKLMNRHRYWRAERRDPARERAVHARGRDDSASRAEAVFKSLVTPSQEAVAREELERFQRAFAELEERDREVVHLAHVEGLAHKDIAARLGINENHSRQLLHRALVRLSKLGLASFLAFAALVVGCRGEHAEPAGTTPAAPMTPEPVVEEAPLPPAPTHYYGREIARTMHWRGAEWLMRETREQEENVALFLDALDVRPGWTVCDLGCGNGFHTLRLAEAVGPDGRVFAVDIQEPMLRMLGERVAEAGFTNVEPILGGVADPKLPDGSCDLILLADVYHEISHPEEMLAHLRRDLKPDGRLVLLEFRAEDPEVPIKPLHKMSKAQILKELQPNGLELVREFDELPWQHLMFFGRATAPAPAPPR